MSATQGQVADSPVRGTQPSGWVLLPDPDEVGIRDGWFAAPRVGAQAAPVPGIIQQVFPDSLGVAWYWASIQLPDAVPDGHRVLLRFGAVDYRATVWVESQLVGSHDNGDTPFELDITDALGGGDEGLLAVRVVAPGDAGADGLELGQIPHRNKKSDGYHPGWMHVHGGILLPVDVVVVPPVRITDVHALPDSADGSVLVRVTVRNGTGGDSACRLRAGVGPDHAGVIEHQAATVLSAPPGDSTLELLLHVADHRRWDLDDPFLYRVSVDLSTSGGPDPVRHQRSVRVGFRELRVVDGFFQLNGRRILLRSSHTGNHFPVGQIVPPRRDLMRRDFINAKATGFNMIRFMSGIAWPEQLDLCDELGLMIYEEPGASWLLKDSAQMTEVYDRSLREMILRDRNHPSVTVWGLLTETLDGPVFRHAVGTLGMVRELDPTRLVILNSGRFDAQPAIGSVSNPGGTIWEHTWGHEAPGAPGRTLVPDPATGWLTMSSWVNGDLSLAGSIEGNGDTHTYPIVPHAPSAIAFLRGLGRDTKPHMLSEYGIGSLMNVIGETRDYEQAGARPDLLDAALVRSMAERFEADWTRYGMDDIYPFPEDMLLEAQRLHGRQRALGFDIVRSNPRIPAFNVTGLLDHALTGEGFWTFWRRWKPGIVDVLSDGWAPLKWCLFSEPRHAYTGGQLRLEAVLANEDVLAPGRYPARFRLHGPDGIAWEAEQEVVIPDATGAAAPLAVPVLDVTITAPSVAGRYTFAAELRHGGRPTGGRLAIEVTADPGVLASPARVRGWGLDERITGWLTAHGVSVEPQAGASSDGPDVILVGELPAADSTLQAWRALVRRICGGAVAIFLSPAAFVRQDAPLGWLPLEHSGSCEPFYDWVYHREWVSTRHGMLDGLPGPGVMDWDIYGPLLAKEMFEGLPDSDDVAAAAFAVGYSRPGGYASGIVAGSYPLGEGRFLINTFQILERLGQHPAADRMLLNLVEWGHVTARPDADIQGDDVEALLHRIGFR